MQTASLFCGPQRRRLCVRVRGLVVPRQPGRDVKRLEGFLAVALELLVRGSFRGLQRHRLLRAELRKGPGLGLEPAGGLRMPLALAADCAVSGRIVVRRPSRFIEISLSPSRARTMRQEFGELRHNPQLRPNASGGAPKHPAASFQIKSEKASYFTSFAASCAAIRPKTMLPVTALPP